eukprot:GHVS01005285.1.p1 GENE.GHVS01005285.1~~GHVS01005285.1.p1  ORF type:complete len:458 (+),score=61.68 GHVS01005285.1:175-1548(+)
MVNCSPQSYQTTTANTTTTRQSAKPLTCPPPFSSMATDTKTADNKQPKQGISIGSGGRSFGGFFGCLVNIILLPLLCIFLYNSCSSKSSCVRYDALLLLPTTTTSMFSTLSFDIVFERFFNPTALLILCVWITVHALLYCLLPGEVVFGEIPKGVIMERANLGTTTTTVSRYTTTTSKPLKYTINGHLHFWITVCVCLFGIPKFGNNWFTIVSFSSLLLPPLEIIQDLFLPLIVWSIVLSFLFSFLLYIVSFRSSTTQPPLLSENGSSGTAVEQLFMGRELNPRLCLLGHSRLFLDLKVFMDLRVGLFGWLVVNLSSCLYQLNRLGHINGALVALTLFQAVYILDAQIQEKCILTTMDITTEGLGFMLIFGNITWVPMVYSLCSRYVMIADPNVSTFNILLATVVFVLGYYIFRASNSQKDAFRRNPNNPDLAHLRTLSTKRGAVDTNNCTFVNTTV